MGRLERWLRKDEVTSFRTRSDRMAAWIDNMTPNKITLFGLLMALGAVPAFLLGKTSLGVTLGTLSYATDLLDGALARYQHARMPREEIEAQAARPFMERRGMTDDGGWFDPLVDKIRYFGFLLPLGLGLLWWPLIALGGFFALALTIGRPVVAKLKLSKGKSNFLGKHKVHVEAVLLAWLVFVPWAPWSSAVAHGLLVLATLGGAASFAGQAYSVWKNSKNAKAPT
ncbi:MAG TPA: CDP-alcohol phosphatidyltransferase family protein [Candidatus Baltobacteraceae bacterium]|nr:CDP-alcohol phosphatidyltransferase family protein [Candidatus Baltobacteraceae bacterium]